MHGLQRQSPQEVVIEYLRSYQPNLRDFVPILCIPLQDNLNRNQKDLRQDLAYCGNDILRMSHVLDLQTILVLLLILTNYTRP